MTSTAELLRTDLQRTKLNVAILVPDVMLACRVNQSFTSKDKIVEVAYDGVTAGSYLNILPDMWVFIGSTPGAHDRGACFTRKAATANKIYLSETSEVNWADNLYITVYDFLGLRPRPIVTRSDLVTLYDYDLAYSSQHASYAPVVVIGPHAVAWLENGSAQISFDASQSWCLSAGAKSYQWTASVGTFNNPTSATPVLTVEEWRNHVLVQCTVTVGGVSSTGARYVLLFDDDHPPAEAQITSDPDGDWGDGGWNFSVKMWGQAALSQVSDAALCVLFADDYYGSERVSLGPVVGRENIVAWGWIAGESIDANYKGGSVTFDVQGPHWWMAHMEMTSGLQVSDIATAPTKWSEIQGLNIDKALFELLYWRSSAAAIMDIFLTGDTRQAPQLTITAGKLWDQIQSLAGKIFAKGGCNRLGQLYVRIDVQMIPILERGAIPMLDSVTKQDWKGSLSINRRAQRNTARVDLVTISYTSGGTAKTLYHLAPGHVPATYGDITPDESILSVDQAQGNALAGLLFGRENIPYEFGIDLASNNRLVDVFPPMYIPLEVEEGDTPRGIAYTGNAVPRHVTLQQVSNALRTSVDAEAESIPIDGINGDVPVDPEEPPLEPPDEPPFPPTTPFPPELPEPPAPPVTDLVSAVLLANSGLFFCDNFNEEAPVWNSLNDNFSPDDILAIVSYGMIAYNRYGKLYVAAGEKYWSGTTAGVTLKHDSTWFRPYFPDYYRICSMECKFDAPDTLWMLVGKGYPAGYGRLFTGSSAGLSAPTVTIPRSVYQLGSLLFLAGKIILIYASDLVAWQTICRISSNGKTIEYEKIDSTFPHEGNTFGCQGGTFIFSQFRNSRLSNAITTETMMSSTFTVPFPRQRLAAGTGGNKLMSAGRRSFDAGTTWEVPMAPFSSLGNIIYQALSDDIWVAANGSGLMSPNSSRVWTTSDFGVTWLDKTGNLREIAGESFEPLMIKAR